MGYHVQFSLGNHWSNIGSKRARCTLGKISCLSIQRTSGALYTGCAESRVKLFHKEETSIFQTEKSVVVFLNDALSIWKRKAMHVDETRSQKAGHAQTELRDKLRDGARFCTTLCVFLTLGNGYQFIIRYLRNGASRKETLWKFSHQNFKLYSLDGFLTQLSAHTVYADSHITIDFPFVLHYPEILPTLSRYVEISTWFVLLTLKGLFSIRTCINHNPYR